MQAAPDSTPPRYRGMVRQLRHQFGPFLAHLSAPSHPARAVYCALLGARVLIGSWLVLGTQCCGQTGGPLQAHCAKEIYGSAGLRGFFLGFSACALRAMPANAAAFGGFELAMSLLP